MNNENMNKANNAKAKTRLGRWFWPLAAIGAVILVLRCTTGGTSSAVQSDESRIKGGTVVIERPSAEEVEAQRRKRAEELRQEEERKRLEEERKRQEEERKRQEELRRLALEKEKLRADISVREAKYRSDVQAIVEKYRKMLPLSEAEEHFRDAEQGAGFIASSDGLCGFKVCASLAYKMAYDMVKGTQRTEEAINPIVDARVVAPIEEAVKVYEKWTEEFRQELQREEMAFAIGLAARSQKFNETVSCLKRVDSAKMSAAVDKLVDEVRNHAEKAAWATVESVVELAMSKSSYATIKAIVMRIAGIALGGVAKKLASTATAAVGAAVADGPLPIGDIVGGCVTVVGLGWVAYDIYKVCKTMPQEMREGIQNAIDATRESLRKTAIENLNSDRDVCLRSANSRVQELKAMIK